MTTIKRVKNGTKVIMGQLDRNTYNGIENRIQLFDGQFTTGYRITKFVISPSTPASADNTASELYSLLSTEPKSQLGYWHWNDIEQLAWAAWNPTYGGRHGTYSELRPENMVVEDLYIQTYTPEDVNWMFNYMIVLEKYEFTAWDGAAVLVRNQSQAGPT